MKTYRVTAVFDYEIDDDRIDEDTLHDMLRDLYEEGRTDPDEDDEEGYRLESVREISVVEVDD